jgi:hypothetical protein
MLVLYWKIADSGLAPCAFVRGAGPHKAPAKLMYLTHSHALDKCNKEIVLRD